MEGTGTEGHGEAPSVANSMQRSPLSRRRLTSVSPCLLLQSLPFPDPRGVSSTEHSPVSVCPPLFQGEGLTYGWQEDLPSPVETSLTEAHGAESELWLLSASPAGSLAHRGCHVA